MKFTFDFPLELADQWDGFNDAGIEHFSGSPFQHLGREVPQNTLDARVAEPAKLSISLKHIALRDLPDAKSLAQIIGYCLIAAEKEDNPKATAFFKNAQKLLSATSIAVLEISDSNTTGVTGPCQNGKPFYALLKAVGQSAKRADSTGSYGLGKFAPFTVSGLRTVFVSTVWQASDEKWYHYVQGKSVLMSFEDGKRRTHRGTGFWGAKNFQPVINSLNDLPSWLRRVNVGDPLADKAGTTLNILGFEAIDGWEKIITSNIIENFFGAIKRGGLEVQVTSSYSISAQTLSSLVDDLDLRSSVSTSAGEPDRFDNTKHYLHALSSNPEVIVETTENFYLGHCELRLVVADQLPKKVSFLRNGMLITASLDNLKRFREFKDFAAVLECYNSKGLALLRAMEPPRHDAFEPERLTPVDRALGRAALRDITAWVRTMLKKHAQNQVTDVTEIKELAEFFADEGADGLPQHPDENLRGALVIRSRPVKVNTLKNGKGSGNVDQTHLETDAEGNDSITTDDGERNGVGEGGPAGKKRGTAAAKPTASTFPIALGDVRAIPITDVKRKVTFTPSTSGKFRIAIQGSGADSNFDLPIRNIVTTAGSGPRLEIDLVENKRFSLEVELVEPFAGSVRVLAIAV